MAPFQLRFVLPIITKTNKSGEHEGKRNSTFSRRCDEARLDVLRIDGKPPCAGFKVHQAL